MMAPPRSAGARVLRPCLCPSESGGRGDTVKGLARPGGKGRGGGGAAWWGDSKQTPTECPGALRRGPKGTHVPSEAVPRLPNGLWSPSSSGATRTRWVVCQLPPLFGLYQLQVHTLAVTLGASWRRVPSIAVYQPASGNGIAPLCCLQKLSLSGWGPVGPEIEPPQQDFPVENKHLPRTKRIYRL